jgi:hypothetical protein
MHNSDTHISLKKFVQKEHARDSEYLQVEKIGDLLFTYLCKPDIHRKISDANGPGKSSHAVQKVFLDCAEELGFHSEKKGLFGNHPTSGLRPDYYLKTSRSGILLEVERGKTTMNNMDLLDLWKCHICSEANYLFLMVPKQLTQNTSNAPNDTFKKVVDRMTPFFIEGNYTNVLALYVYGY